MSFPFTIDQLYDLFYTTVHTTLPNPYTPEQLQAWAPDIYDEDVWQKKFDEDAWFIANDGKTLIGYASLSPTGVIDLLFVHPDYQRQGIATALLAQALTQAKAKGLPELSTCASLMAKDFFEKNEFKLVQENQVVLQDQTLTNFLMKRPL